MPYIAQKTRKSRAIKTVSAGGLITFEQFHELVDENIKADLLDGKIIRDSPAIPKHGRIVSWLVKVLGLYVEQLDLGEVFVATTTVRLTKYQGPEPDVFFIRKDRLGIVGEKYVDGPPDLCVELISKTSRKIDRGRKFVLYAEHGVKEYWIIDPLRDTVEFYENHEGEWVGIEPDEQGRLHSKVLPGFWLKPECLVASPLPPVLKTLHELLGEKLTD
ncbi:MAG: Uma2 family endonuclease [candidate division KSB1 bacterium]|nr:Uma2 family endonuclease [candidate division KSB1 bacterium]MDZ7303275.1 Uma2 family endonuclease [candidate division KSB1 bacterium]MDZ7312579.1 Uma2 family endonuclease [candidate division KSB1 bacterium]